MAISKGTFTDYDSNGGANDAAATSVASASFSSAGAGLLIAVATWEDINSSSLTFTDNKGNTWQSAVVEDSGAGLGPHCAICWSVPTSVGASHVVTCNIGASAGFRRCCVLNVNGNFNAADALITSDHGYFAGSSTADAGTLITAVAAILVHGCADYGGDTFTQGSGWTKDSAGTGRHFQSRVEAAGGTFDPAGTLSSVTGNANVAMAFKETAGGGGTNSVAWLKA